MRIRLPTLLFKHPIARDPRVKIHWRDGKDGKHWYALLTGNDDVALRWVPKKMKWPSERSVFAEPRAPTGTDMNVLFVFLYLMDADGVVVLSSMRQAVRTVFNGFNPIYPHQIMDSIRLWSFLSVTLEDVVLGPPIKTSAWGGDGKAITLQICKDWVDLCRDKKRTMITYYMLPFHGTPQNMCLYTQYLGSKKNIPINPFAWHVSANLNAKKYDRPGSNCHYMANDSWIVVRKWYLRNGGSCEARRLRATLKVLPQFYKSGQPRKARVKQIPSGFFHLEVKRPTRRSEEPTWRPVKPRTARASSSHGSVPSPVPILTPPLPQQ